MSRALRLLVVMAMLAFGGDALAQAAGFVATVVSESTDLRQKASDSAPTLDTVLKGTKLPAFGLSPDKKWVRVRAPDGSTVWVARADVKVAKATDPDPTEMAEPVATAAPKATPKPAETAVAAKPTPAPSRPPKGLGGGKKVAHVIVDKTKLQLNATKSSPTLAVVKRNDEFEVGGFSRDQLWVKVRTSDGRIGYIQKSDLRPGPAGIAKAAPTPRPRPKDDFEDPNAGFSGPPPEDDFAPRAPRRRRMATAADTTIWAEAGAVLINQTMDSNEGFGYSLNAMGYGAGVRFERRLFGGLFVEGGYLGTSNQRIPAPKATPDAPSATVFSTLHRLDVSARYKLFFMGEEGPNVSALAGFQNYSFLVQPQNLSWFYSQIYMSGAVGAGGEVPFGDFRADADFRYFVPVIASQRYGEGGEGGDGQSSTSSGYSFGVGIRRVFYSGGSLGLAYRGHFYETQFSGTGRRGNQDVTGVRIQDSFSAITLTYARGF